MSAQQFWSAAHQTFKRTASFAQKFAVPGMFFSLANVFNFAQSGNLCAESIAGANLVAATYFATQNNFKTAMRVTSGCTLAVGGVLATTILLGAAPALLFPAAAAFCFGVGNALASMDKPRLSPAVF